MRITTVKIDETGEYYIELPEDIIKELGWAIGDELVWTINEDDTITLRKKG